jgi:hypothetical protein
MTKPAYRKGSGSAKAGAEENLGTSRRDHRWFAPVLAELRKVFRQKLAAELALIANRSTRVCEDWIATPPRGAPDGEALAALLNSRIGDVVLLALTRSCAEPWRKKLHRQLEIAQLLDQQRETAARLAALQNGDL